MRPTDQPTTILEAREASKSFRLRTVAGMRELIAVNGVSFMLFPGESVGLVGESGCGKSTLARLLVNLESLTKGDICFQGISLTKLSEREMRSTRQDLQIIFQDPFASLNGRMRIRELIGEPFRVHRRINGLDLALQVERVLEQVGLSKDIGDQFPHQLSGGQRQRVAIGRAVALNPKVVICDEPVSALDVSVQAQILNLLRGLRVKMGLTYLFISHDLYLVRYMCDRTMVMYLGDIVEEGMSEDVFSHPRHPYTQILMSAAPSPSVSLGRPERVRPIGDVPSPLSRPTGCTFHTRCPIAQEVCRVKVPELRDLGGGHRSACHFAETADVRKSDGLVLGV